jgi:hypothetical protein
MFLETIVFGFAVAWLRGGRLKDDFGLHHMWLAPVAFMLQVFNRMVVPTSVQIPVTMLSYALLFYFAWINFRSPGIPLVGVGMLLNVLVIAANGGRMPVALDTARGLGIDVSDFAHGVVAKHMALTAASRLQFLGDVIPMPWPIARVISVGDIFAVIGAFLIVQEIMGKPLSSLRSDKPA